MKMIGMLCAGLCLLGVAATASASTVVYTPTITYVLNAVLDDEGYIVSAFVFGVAYPSGTAFLGRAYVLNGSAVLVVLANGHVLFLSPDGRGDVVLSGVPAHR